MKGFAAGFFAILVICVFAAGCESASRNDGVSRFAWSSYDGPGSAPREAPWPGGPTQKEGSI